MTNIYETDVPNLKKDMGSKAVLNTDLTALHRYKMERNRIKENEILKDKIEKMEANQNEVNSKLDTLNNRIDELLAVLGKR